MKSILIVEDDNILCESIAEIIRLEGWSAITTQRGTDALAITLEQPLDLILSDINVPGINGLELFEKVQQDPTTAQIPFIFITAHYDISVIQEKTGLPAKELFTSHFPCQS